MFRYLLIILIALAGVFFTADHLVAPDNSTETAEKKFISDLYKVVYVTDGDTFVIETEGGTESVRLIGIDAPETEHSQGEEECMASEATDHLRQLIDGKEAEIIIDPTQDTYDDYDRLLAYTEIEGTDIGLAMIKAGLAREFTFIYPYERQKTYQMAEETTRKQGIGVWSCDKSKNLSS